MLDLAVVFLDLAVVVFDLATPWAVAATVRGAILACANVFQSTVCDGSPKYALMKCAKKKVTTGILRGGGWSPSLTTRHDLLSMHT